jgi:hypothetical protein
LSLYTYKEEGRGKKEEGRRKREEGRRKKDGAYKFLSKDLELL